MAQQLEANSGVPDRDPDLVSLIESVCERSGIPFDVRSVPEGTSVKQFVDQCSNLVIPVPRGNKLVWVKKDSLSDEDRATMIAMGLPVPSNDEVKS
jgi:hypothetical protein